MGFSRVSYAVVVCAALVAVLTFWMMREAYDALDVVSLGPVVGSANASKAINQRYNAVKKDFELALGTSGWTVLRTGANVSIETLQGGEVGVYIRTTAYFQAQPETVYNAFHWNRFEETQKKIDPFFESAELLKEVDRGMLLIRKVVCTVSSSHIDQLIAAADDEDSRHIQETSVLPRIPGEEARPRG